MRLPDLIPSTVECGPDGFYIRWRKPGTYEYRVLYYFSERDAYKALLNHHGLLAGPGVAKERAIYNRSIRKERGA